MSVFKDDINLSNSVQKIQTNIINFNNIRENSNVEQAVPKKQEEFEKVELSDKTQKNQEYNTEIESIQTQKNILETTKQGLNSINNELEEIKKVVNESFENIENTEKTNESVKNRLKNIENIVNDTSFNEIKPLKESSYDNTKTDVENNDKINVSANPDKEAIKIFNLPNPEEVSLKSKEDSEKFLQQVNKTTDEIVEKQKEIAKKEEGLVKQVDSLIEFESKIDLNYMDNSKNETGNKLKEAAINGIIENPINGKRIQVETLDKDILLALLSITRRGS